MQRMQPSCHASVRRTLHVLGVVWVCALGGEIGVHHSPRALAHAAEITIL